MSPRIAYDHQVFVWQEYGGISRYIYEIAGRIAQTEGYVVSVVAPLHVNRYLAHASTDLRVLGMRIPKFPKTSRIYKTVNSALTVPIMAWFKPDLVHETYYSAVSLAPKRAKVVLTVHDMIHERFKQYFSQGDPTSQNKALAVRRADHVICISEQTRRDLIELFKVDPAKLSVVSHGFSLIDRGVKTTEDVTSGRPFLLYVGNRGAYKNFEGLLLAFAAAPRLRNEYDLVCFGGGRLTAEENNSIARLRIPDRQVRQMSGDDAVLAGLYRTARALVFPSLYEGFGIPPLEAMSFDCPVVCSGVSSIPEVVGDAAVLFNPRDRDSMQTAIERIVDDNELRHSLIARGRERVKLFSWNRCAQETRSIYQRVLS